MPRFRPEHTDPTCVYSAVIPSAAIIKTNATPHEDSASAPAHTSRFDNSPRVSENPDLDSKEVSHRILSCEVPTNQLCAGGVRSPPFDEIRTMKLDISDKGGDFLYPQHPNITKHHKPPGE